MKKYAPMTPYVFSLITLLIMITTVMCTLKFNLMLSHTLPRGSYVSENSLPLIGHGRAMEEIVYAHGTSAVVWAQSEKSSEYSFSCVCNQDELAEFLAGNLPLQSGNKSPVTCQGTTTGGIGSNSPYCDPYNQ